MIALLEKLTELEKRQRLMVAGGVLVVVALLCYGLITHGSVSHYWQASHAKDAIEIQKQKLTLIQSELRVAEKKLAKTQQLMQTEKDFCCTVGQVESFFEQITTWAVDFNLTPISRVVLPKRSVENDEKTSITQQAVDIVVEGHAQNLIDFMTMLEDRPQKVSIQNLRVALPREDSSNPRAAFRVVLLVDSQSEGIVL